MENQPSEKINWSDVIRIDKSWHTNVLNHHFTEIDGKVTVCLHSVCSTGSQIRSDALVKKLFQLMPEFVLGEKRIQEIKEPMEISFQTAQYFGNTDPEKDGKYGELLLFALVESLLECKMVAHKIRALSSMNDQVKGGDGVFIGLYQVSQNTMNDAIFIGESKVVSNFNTGLTDAFKSIYRVHDPNVSHLFREAEWVVALDNLIHEEEIDIDELYNRLNPTTVEYQNQNLVHPILIMYDSGQIRDCENKCTTKEELENSLLEKLPTLSGDMLKSINKQLEKYQEVKAVHLHFFMIPFNNVSAFRKAMYSRLHNSEYRPKVKIKE